MYASTSQDTKTLAGRLADTRRQPQRNCQLRLVGLRIGRLRTGRDQGIFEFPTELICVFWFYFLVLSLYISIQIENTQKGNLVSWGTIHRLVAKPVAVLTRKVCWHKDTAWYVQCLPEPSRTFSATGREGSVSGRTWQGIEKSSPHLLAEKKQRCSSSSWGGGQLTRWALHTDWLGLGWSVGWNRELESEAGAGLLRTSSHCTHQHSWRIGRPDEKGYCCGYRSICSNRDAGKQKVWKMSKVVASWLSCPTV